MELEPILPSPTESGGQSSNMTGVEASSSGGMKAEKKSAPQVTAAQTSSQPVSVQMAQQIAPVSPTVSDQTQTQPTAAGPVIADDVDVIEKEWVDKAKSIVSSTKDNPHMQEKEVSKLQADYLMKRYGKKMKTVE